jgi:alkylation response protein AidB-like acyl-CoA dehydrogenase
MVDEQPGRQALASWIASRPTNYYSATPNLRASLSTWATEGLADSIDATLAAFGRVVAELIDPSVATLERHRELPALLAYDSIGRRIDTIEFHPAYRDVGIAVWRSGLLAADGSGGSAFEQAALFYLLSLVGEGGHACPAVCTAGLARAIRHRGSAALQERFLGGLTTRDYDRCLRGSQFLTEVQGGSDVGANAAVAVRDDGIAGAWRISGEKWFCSVADADLFAVTARPDGATTGTRGLGCFVVPRLLDDGSPNGFRIRRL